MNAQNSFIAITLELLEKNKIEVSPLSGLTELDIALSLGNSVKDPGQIWINAVEASMQGEIVIRTHSNSVRLADIGKAINELTKKVLFVLEMDGAYKMRIESYCIRPDVNEPVDAENLYMMSLNLCKEVSSPGNAVQSLVTLLELPPEQLGSLLESAHV